MKSPTGNVFENLESAHDFVTLLTEMVIEAKRELEADVAKESSITFSGRLDVLRMTLYSLEKLERHMTHSCHILDDLRHQQDLLCRSDLCSHKRTWQC